MDLKAHKWMIWHHIPFFPTLPCGVFVFLAASRRLRLRLPPPPPQQQHHNIINTSPSTHHQQHNTINISPSTQHRQHITIKNTPSTQHHQQRTINTSPSTRHHQHNTSQHHPHNTINTPSSTLAAPQCHLAWQVLGAPPVRFVWQAQHLDHLHKGPRKPGDN